MKVLFRHTRSGHRYSEPKQTQRRQLWRPPPSTVAVDMDAAGTSTVTTATPVKGFSGQAWRPRNWLSYVSSGTTSSRGGADWEKGGIRGVLRKGSVLYP